jgi:hypothetical protein
MLQSLRSFAISLAVASFLASGLRIAFASEPAAGGTTGVSLASIPVSYDAAQGDVNSVRLELPAGAPQQVRVRLSSNGTWHACNTVNKVARCSTPGATVQALARLEVEAA